MKKIIILLLSLTLLVLLFKRVGFDLIYGENDKTQELEKELLKKRASELKEINQGKNPKQNLCGNSYFPFVPGSNWRYNVTFGEQTDILAINIPSEKENKQPVAINILQTNFSLITNISCSPKGIIIDNLNFLHILDSLGIISTPREIRGFFIPTNFNGGSPKWNFEIVSRNELAENSDKVWEKRVNIKLEFMGEEEIKGLNNINYKAYRLDSFWFIEERDLENPDSENDQRDGEEIPENENLEKREKTATCTFWLADQTGIVKSIYKEKGVEYPIILELRSFQIPAI